MQHVQCEHTSGTVGYVTANNPRYNLFYDALERLQVPSGTALIRATNYNAAFSRNELVSRIEGDWIFFLDDDHAFEPDALLRLLNRNVPIVGALYSRRYPPFVTTTYKQLDVAAGTGELFTWEDFDSMNGMIEVAATGTGGFLVRKNVFQKLPAKCFRIGMTEERDWISEDVWFCDQAAKAGFKIHLDLDVSLAHLTETFIIPKREAGKFVVRRYLSNRQWHS